MATKFKMGDIIKLIEGEELYLLQVKGVVENEYTLYILYILASGYGDPCQPGQTFECADDEIDEIYVKIENQEMLKILYGVSDA